MHSSIFKKIVSETIKCKRVSSKITQIDLACACFISSSLLSRIESGKYNIDIKLAKTILKELKSDFIIDLNLNQKYSDKFEKFYYNIILVNDENINKLWNDIEGDKDKILNSLMKYRYHLYQTVYRLDRHYTVDEAELLNLLNYLDYYNDKDKQILYDNIGIFYKRAKNIDESNKYFKLALDINGDELVKAMVLQHYGANLTVLESYSNAIEIINDSLLIFEKHGIKERMVNCYLIIGYYLSDFNEKEGAIEYFQRVIKIGNERNTKIAIHNILWCYIELNDIKALEMIEKMSLSNPSDYNLVKYELILRYLLKNKKYDYFNQWYEASLLCDDKNELYSTTIQLYKNIIDHQDIKVIEDCADYALSLVRFPYDKESYITIHEVLINEHNRIGDFKQAYKYSQKILKLKNE